MTTIERCDDPKKIFSLGDIFQYAIEKKFEEDKEHMRKELIHSFVLHCKFKIPSTRGPEQNIKVQGSIQMRLEVMNNMQSPFLDTSFKQIKGVHKKTNIFF